MMLRRAASSTSTAIAAVTPVPAASTSALRSFSTSAISQESKRKRKTRIVRKSNLEKKAALRRQDEATAPDPILGYAKGQEHLWEESLLKSILLDREQVWGQTVTVLPDEGIADASSSANTNANASTSASSMSPSSDTDGSRLLNFGLTDADARLLFKDLPVVSAYRDFVGKNTTKLGALAEERYEKASSLEDEKRARVERIVDLRNANSKGIHVENTRRIVKAFGRTSNDTGLPEVQAAILTARIHSLSDHLAKQPRDIHNRRPLRSLVQQRAKTLKYLRSVDVQRYEDCLIKIGVEARAVEGEVVLRA